MRFESEETYLGRKPSTFLLREIETLQRLSPGNRALDIACGEGRNSIYLAQHGFLVTALDISDIGIVKAFQRAEEERVQIDFQRVDLDEYKFTDQFDLIIIFNFLQRELIPKASQALSPGGLLIIDTILESPELLALHNPAYLLRRGELRSLCERLPGEVLINEELNEGEMPTARIMFRKKLP
jgi:2-polyprenyl-3-methyl-5-hydroxy-6-metoxy-1,4-benzoquinol methylase